MYIRKRFLHVAEVEKLVFIQKQNMTVQMETDLNNDNINEACDII